MKANQGTPVQIFGQVYRLRSDEDADRVRQIAEMVDQRMNRIADRGASADNYRIAVLAALELADELYALKDKHAELQSLVDAKSSSLAALLDKAVKEASK
ncbi:MAG: cell division protein ZapA [Acidobacteria bacterium]|nr:cell division protein ZapA [Acidobacteriota bacterium]MDA1233516.1 cell division protein ZapA [Acidobacteriota bacterium]